MASLTQGNGVRQSTGTLPRPQQHSTATALPEMFTVYNNGTRNLLQTFEAVQIRRHLLYAALTHFFVGLVTILLTILLGSTVTEAILAVWALFSGVVGFGAICVHRAHSHTAAESVSFAKIWLQIYLGMTGLGAILAMATVIHGAVLLGMSVPVQNRQRNPADLQEFITSSFSVWFVILGASNIVIGFAAGAADLILIKKTVITLRSHKTVLTGQTTSDLPPNYLDIPPPRYSVQGEAASNLSLAALDVKPDVPTEAPPSYEASVTVPLPGPDETAAVSVVAPKIV